MASSRSAQCRTAVSSCDDDATKVVVPSASAPLDGDTSSTVASEPSSELTADEKSEQYDSFDEMTGNNQQPPEEHA